MGETVKEKHCLQHKFIMTVASIQKYLGGSQQGAGSSR